MQIFFTALFIFILLFQTRLNAQFGYALLFNGSSGYVRANSVSITLGDAPNMTIETWCYPTASSGWRSIAAFNFTGDLNNNKNMIEYDAGTQRFAYYDEVIKEKYSSSTFAPNAWYHVAVVITGGNCFLYVNGTNQNTFSTAVRPDGSVNGLFSIGQEWDNTTLSEFFEGYIDEVRIWNIARSQADIQNNLYSTLAGNEPGLIAYYTMSDGGGTVLTDITGNGHTGSLIGGVLFSTPSPPLPVELTSFTANVQKRKVILNWQTETEVNNYGFEIERKVGSGQSSVDNYEKIGFVNGSGNSNSPKDYSFVDNMVSAGKYFYRLKQIDNDGQFEYSKTIEVDINGVNKFELSQNYPNPFNPTTTISYILPQEGMVKLTLYNILGQEVRTLVNEVKEAGAHTINFNASDLNSGVYIYKIESGSFTQTMKMTLIK